MAWHEQIGLFLKTTKKLAQPVKKPLGLYLAQTCIHVFGVSATPNDLRFPRLFKPFQVNQSTIIERARLGLWRPQSIQGNTRGAVYEISFIMFS